MSFKFSQGFCKTRAKRQDCIGVDGTDIAINANNITRTAGDFVTAGFKIGDKVYVKGAANAGNNIAAEVIAVSDTVLTFADGTFPVAEAVGNKITIYTSRGGSFADQFNGGTLTFFNGTKPVNADADKGGATALVTFSNLWFDESTYDGVNEYVTMDLKNAPITANAIATGTATWGRLTAKGNERDSASTVAIRGDGSVGGVGSDIAVATTALVLGEPHNLSGLQVRFRISY